jgi:putative membrane protein
MHPVEGAAHALASASIRHWELNPVVLGPLTAMGVLYAAGIARLWHRAGIGRGISRWSATSFAAGWLTMAAALVSPVAWVSQILFSVHMTQHMLLMLVVAPLLAFGQPLLAWLWVFAGDRRNRIAGVCRSPRFLRAWQALSAPLSVFLIQAVALWIWHVPSWYAAALHSETVHAVQHVSFVLAGSLFWWAMVHGRYGRMGYGLGVLYVFLTAIHTGALGALLTVAPSVWYGDHARQAVAWRFDALVDQQLAGLLMWIPASVMFILFGLALLAAWLGEAERRARLTVTDAASRTVLTVVLLCGLAASGCGAAGVQEAEALTGGSVSRGASAIGKYGCATCHTIPGIAGAATVGPPLDRIALRHYLGGRLTNTPGNLIKWVQHPQAIDPKTAMPELGVSDDDARDIAAFLYTLR